jgi:GT2 family glycosyltransferase
MSDEVSRILNEQTHSGTRAPGPRQTQNDPTDPYEAAFDSAGYLRVNPDIAEAIRNGEYQSAYSHYVEKGFLEGRPSGGRPREPRNTILPPLSGALGQRDGAGRLRCSFESITFSKSGGIMLIGWLDDVDHPLDCVRITGPSWRVIIDGQKLIRIRRPDAEDSLGVPAGHLLGVLGFIWTGRGGSLEGPCVVEFWTNDGRAKSVSMTPRQVDDVELRNTLLSYLASAQFLGNPTVEALTALGQGLGEELVVANRAMTDRITAAPYVERFGPDNGTPRGSIIVVLYGKPEFMFLQTCLYSGLSAMAEYEFVFVCNSPELAEAVLREALIADLIYGLQQTVVILPGNAGFGAANNVGAKFARSNRLLMVNPDVFPRDRDWARKHTDLLGSLRADQCRLFGIPMYYDDGSLMHGGMYFEIDRGLSLVGGSPRAAKMVRVEHYGKGAPPDAERYVQSRPVPAVGGAFISCDRTWFESLGGFTEDYVFGHYEDADLCLKSLGRGTVPWLHDLRMWHLEGKGSIRLPPHEGGTIVNRWLFSSRWSEMIEGQIEGQTPKHPLFASRDAKPALAPVVPDLAATVASPVQLVAPRRRSEGTAKTAKPMARPVRREKLR